MSNAADVKQTKFYHYHVEAGGKMVPFAGYLMPLQYTGVIMQEHLHTREKAGLFDVSHMGQLVIEGKGAAAALERLVPVDLGALAIGQQSYATFTSELGGILDDLIITRWADNCFFLVVNASCKEQDIKHLREHLDNLDITYLSGQSLVALQGPKAKIIIGELAPAANELLFMNGCRTSIGGIDCYVTRSGYTGEDGFEISVADENATALADQLLAYDDVQWVGLGARDSLRLEAGLCLYGHDMDRGKSPVEAGLSWSISQSRREGGSKSGGFLGSDQILKHLADGVSTKRVGFVIDGRAPVREGAEIVDDQGNVVGVITSGGFGPTLQMPVAMGYVKTDFSAVGTKLDALVRGKSRAMTLVKMPMVPQRYYRGD